MIDKVQSFIDLIKHECYLNGVKFTLVNNSRIDCTGDKKIFASGYFTDDPAELKVAIKKELKEWLGVLIHESCHMDQYMEFDPVYFNALVNDVDVNTIIDDYILKKKINKSVIKEAIQKSIAIELDCEKRSVAKIIDRGLDEIINVEEYIQQSHAYILGYLYILETKSFFKEGCSPYSQYDIWSKMPTTFHNINYNKLKSKYRQLYLDKCF